MNLSDLKFHELSNLFPLIEDEDELRRLGQDILTNGLLEQIVVLDGLVLDGRNRVRACQFVGYQLSPNDVIQYEEYFGDTDPFQFVMSKNLQRRHLSTSQRAALGADVFKWLTDHQNSRGEKGGWSIEDRTKEIHQRYGLAASVTQVSATSVKRAVGVLNSSPELHKEVRAGTKTLHEATQAVKRKKESKKVDPQQRDEAQERIREICGAEFWARMTKKEVVGLKTATELVAFAARSDQEMRKLSGAMYWGDLSVAEGVKFVKERLGKHATKKWALEDFFAMMGSEPVYREGVTIRSGAYRVTIERCTPEALKKQREASRSGSSKGGTNHE